MMSHMNEHTNQLLLPIDSTRTRFQRRIRTYTRKLAEMEHFLDRHLVLTNDFTDTNIHIHKYWQ